MLATSWPPPHLAAIWSPLGWSPPLGCQLAAMWPPPGFLLAGHLLASSWLAASWPPPGCLLAASWLATSWLPPGCHWLPLNAGCCHGLPLPSHLWPFLAAAWMAPLLGCHVAAFWLLHGWLPLGWLPPTCLLGTHPWLLLATNRLSHGWPPLAATWLPLAGSLPSLGHHLAASWLAGS